MGVRRKSALSWRKSRRNSAREVKHSVRFFGAFVNQVVNQYPDVGFGAFQYQRFQFRHGAVGVDARHQALASRFFIARCAVDLAGKKQVFNQMRFQRRLQLHRREKVVLNGIARSKQS